MENNVQVKENVFAGIIGAFLFALVGGILWFVLYQVGYLAAISGIVGVICAIRGYSFFAKKESIKGIVIAVIMAALVIVVAWYACISYDIYTAYKDWYEAGEVDFSLTFFEAVRSVPYFFQDTEFLVAYLKDLGIGLILCVIGCASYIIKATKKVKNPPVIATEENLPEEPDRFDMSDKFDMPDRFPEEEKEEVKE